MPEKVTREEKIIELAILKAREVKALRDGLTKDEMPTIEKVKRPKAMSATKFGGIKQDKDNANEDNSKPFTNKLKKAYNERLHGIAVKAQQELVHQMDGRIAQLMKNKDKTPQDEKLLASMKIQVEEIYAALTTLKSMKYPKPSKTDEKEGMVAKTNEATDKTNDPRDVIFDKEQQGRFDSVMSNLRETIREGNSKLLSATTSELSKILRTLTSANKELADLEKYLGRVASN
tara:strand:+ start:341 stop:1036 length:696 start_codon:yes stop_codon:yes gene_type:complete